MSGDGGCTIEPHGGERVTVPFSIADGRQPMQGGIAVSPFVNRS